MADDSGWPWQGKGSEKDKFKIHWDLEPRLSLFPFSTLSQREYYALWRLHSSPAQHLALLS